ncbi:MAG: CAP domain-containing protein, partial [Patescibacteria group bacterium]|nr:CAP domain-containing protein [Patescibacteria group bacterium]
MVLVRLFLHYFTPHHTNNQKARVLHFSFLTYVLVFLLLVQAIISFLPQTGARVLGYASQISVTEVISISNQKRVANGLPELKNNPLLAEAARKKGEHMLANDYWAHVAPDGTQPWYFFNLVGYNYKYAGENLARDFANAVSAVDAWMASPSHKENLLSPKYTEIGVAVVEGDLNGVDTTIIVQLFGTQASSSQ